MSSAILYLAIIAIWLCVLIPRWLKRDSARGAVIAADTAADDEAPVSGPADADQADLADDGAPRTAEPGVRGRPAAAPAAAPTPPLSAEEARRRILTGRRRLLGMLLLLEIAAIALAVVGLAALWVIIPPTIMLTGYLLLLREASHADAERAQRQAEAAAHARERAARAKARERARAAQRSTPAEGTPMDAAAVEETTAAAALAAKFAAAPVPADYEDSGRDFAPGLAGKYTTSNADPEPAADDYVYEVPRLRAVGD
jgi:predicted lipid-binding transport protein (Tim44 family)